MAKIYAPPDDITFEFDWRNFDNDRYTEACRLYEQEVRQFCLDEGNGDICGETISFPVADGRATYMVFKTKPLTMLILEYGDPYRVDPIMERGLRLSDVRERIRSEAAIAELFGRK